jgi:diguanylate cyclase (GGDEF)-like protein
MAGGTVDHVSASKGAPGIGRATRAWLYYLLAGVMAAIVYFLLPSTTAKNILYDLLGISAVAAILVSIRLRSPGYHPPWNLLALGLLSFIVGDTVWTVQESLLGVEPPIPSIADAFYLAGYPLLAAGLALLIRKHSPGREWPSFIDAFIVITVMGMLSWTYLMAPYANDPDLTFGERLVSIAYPLGDLLLAAVLIRLLFAPGRRLLAYYLLIVSVILLMITDIAYATMALSDTYKTGSAVDVGWMLSYVFFGVAALHPSMTTLVESHSASEMGVTWRRLAVLTGTLLLAPTVLAVRAALDGHVSVPLVTGGSVILFLLVMARMAGMVRQSKALERRLEFSAFHDHLTGLPNRVLLADRLDQALIRAERQAGRIAVLIVDLDDFKPVNDSFGHQVGDQLLVEVAERLKACLRAQDTAARLGGDEFAILLEGVEEPADATRIAQRILKALQEPFTIGEKKALVSASVGMVLGGSQDRPGDLFRRADIAVYEAKARVKGTYEVFDSRANAKTDST